MQRLLIGCLVLVVAGQAPAAGDPIAGKRKSEDERCQECHGHDGNASDIEDGVGNIGKFPKLAGQYPGYIAKQIRDFRSGERNHEFMALMARSVGDADLADIAAYFSSQQRVRDERAGTNPLGRKLLTEGDAARDLPPCAACHGEAGKGGSAPVIGGQHRRYLHKQLTEWRAGERRNSPGGVMNRIAGALGDAEIEALSEYLSGL